MKHVSSSNPGILYDYKACAKYPKTSRIHVRKRDWKTVPMEMRINPASQKQSHVWPIKTWLSLLIRENATRQMFNGNVLISINGLARDPYAIKQYLNDLN